MGVGAAMAAGNHAHSGHCALLEKAAAMKNPPAIPLVPAGNHLLVENKEIATAKHKNPSPNRFVKIVSKEPAALLALS